jgi:hypothetical protein
MCVFDTFTYIYIYIYVYTYIVFVLFLETPNTMQPEGSHTYQTPVHPPKYVFKLVTWAPCLPGCKRISLCGTICILLLEQHTFKRAAL